MPVAWPAEPAPRRPAVTVDLGDLQHGLRRRPPRRPRRSPCLAGRRPLRRLGRRPSGAVAAAAPGGPLGGLSTAVDASSSSTRSRMSWISSRMAAARSNSSCLAAERISASSWRDQLLDLRLGQLRTRSSTAGAVGAGRLGHGAQPVVDVADLLDDRLRRRCRAPRCRPPGPRGGGSSRRWPPASTR